MSIKLVDALQRIALTGSTWTITMTKTYLGHAAKLRDMGFVRFDPHPRGAQRGSLVRVTQAGMDYLASAGR